MRRFHSSLGLQAIWVRVVTLALLFNCGVMQRPDTAHGQGFELPPVSGGLGDPAGFDENARPTFTATYQLADDDSANGKLLVNVEIPDGWTVYSLEQPSPLIPLSFAVKQPDGASITGKGQPSAAPKRVEQDGMVQEKHTGTVSWEFPIKVAGDLSKPPEIVLSVKGQTCSDVGSCVMIKEEVTATFVGKVAMAVAKPADVSEPAVAKPTMPKVNAGKSKEAGGTKINLPSGFNKGGLTLDLKGAIGGETSTESQPATTEVAEQAKQADAADKAVEKPMIPDGIEAYHHSRSHLDWYVWTEPKVVVPGGKATLVFQAVPEDGYHVYPYKSGLDGDLASATLFVLPKVEHVTWGTPVASTEPKTIVESGLEQTYHEHAVNWRVPIEVAKNAPIASLKLDGMIGFQTCNKDMCDPPVAAKFASVLEVGNQEQAGAVQTKLSDGKRPEVEKAIKDGQTKAGEVTPIVYGSSNEPMSFAYVMLFAFAGGLVLNFMPCVFPVIGLKVMSFISQADGSRRRVFMLNLWYVLGMLTVFWSLAAFAVSVRVLSDHKETYAWGQQFASDRFTITLTCLVFAMALSFLGVWELPIPGFATGRSASGLQQREGYAGAFFKGIFTTLLATPCSGPGLGAVFAYTAANEVVMTPIAFTAIGLGMGFPYILLGLFPSLSRLLPQPGAWMETFKQLMGFVLLFVAAWMFISINNSNTRPTFALLMAVWLGCWIAGQVAIYEPLWKRARAWVFAASVTTAIGLFAFSFLQSTADSYGKGVVKWERYDEARLQALHAEGRTVMLDFTADWCANCKTNSLVALNTQEVSDMLKELDAVPMLADLSDDSPLIWEKLYELKGGAIPYLAIYPGKDPKAPIVMPSIVTKSSVLEALRQAGPSKTVEGKSGKTGTAKNSAKENKKEVSLSEQAPRR